MIRAVVFDLWNTLVHSRGGDPFRQFSALMTEAQRPFFLPFKRDAMVQPHTDARTLLERWRSRLEPSASQFAAMVEVFQEAVNDTQCFPEVPKALLATRDIAQTALLSNTQSFDLGFLERLELTALIPDRCLSAETGFLKPTPGAFETVQKRLGLFPGELAMVGDSWNDDVTGALNAGWTALWLNREGRPRPDHAPEASMVEIPDLSAVPIVIGRLQAGARCDTCLG